MSNTTSNISASTANKTVYKHKIGHKNRCVQSKPNHTLSQVDSHWFDTGFLGFDWLSKSIAIMIVIMNAIMLAMALLAPYTYATVDSWKIDDARGGHAAYIWWMSDNHLFELPSWDTRIVVNHVLRADDAGGRWSWNNPPLYYWLAAIPVYIARIIANTMPSLGITPSDCMKTVQIMQAILMVLLVITCIRLMRKLGLDGKWLAFASALLTTAPCLYYASFQINNDVLMSLFAVLAFIRLITWWMTPSLRNSGMVALYAGLAGLTKANGVMVALIAFIVFMIRLAVWIHHNHNTVSVSIMRWLDWLKDAIMFASVFIPLGLGYQVYEWVRFRVPFFYVQRPFYPWEPLKGKVEYSPISSFYNKFDWYDRLIGHDCFAITQPNENTDYDPCITTVAVKTYTTSLFRARNEFMLACQWFVLIMGVVMFIVLIACMIAMLMRFMLKVHDGGLFAVIERNPGWLIAGIAVLVWLSFYVYCCYREPTTSTPHVRYIMMLFTVFIACITWVCRRLMSDARETTHYCKHSDANDVNKTNEGIACMTRMKAHRAVGCAIIIISCVFAFACMLTVLTLTVQMGTGLAFS